MADAINWFFSTVWPWVIVVAHGVVVVFASGHVVLTKRDTRAALGWMGVIWLAPIMGTLLYFTFGVNRIQRKARRLRGAAQRPSSARGHALLSSQMLEDVLGADAQHLGQLERYVSRLTDRPLLDGNRLTPLTTGREAYDAMLAAIDAAERTVGLMVYIFDNDQTGQRFVEALSRAHERGVAVRVLIDDVGARYTWPSITRVLRKRGVPLATFLPTLIPGRLHYANLRNHRKILVVDGQHGFTGGMNIRHGHLCDGGDHCIQDLHFRVAGPVVNQLAEVFAIDWEFAAGERLEGPGWFPSIACQGESLCRGLSDGPEYDQDEIIFTILGAIGCARDSVEIVTPYFLPEQPLITALNVAAMRGVRVNILLPEVGNLKTVQWASTALLWQVLIRGCRIWLSPPPFDHTKAMVVDGVWSFVGSANWDPRSLRLNFEFNVECYDSNVAKQLGELIEGKRARSREITLADVDGRPMWRRLRDGVARLAQPYL
jgi:cardiolipin synthase